MVSDPENEARWQTENIVRIEHSMLQHFQPEDYRSRLVGYSTIDVDG